MRRGEDSGWHGNCHDANHRVEGGFQCALAFHLARTNKRRDPAGPAAGDNTNSGGACSHHLTCIHATSKVPTTSYSCGRRQGSELAATENPQPPTADTTLTMTARPPRAYGISSQDAGGAGEWTTTKLHHPRRRRAVMPTENWCGAAAARDGSA